MTHSHKNIEQESIQGKSFMSIADKLKNRTKSILKSKYLDVIDLFGGHDNFIKSARGHRILVYHGIDTVGARKYNTRFISQPLFNQHLNLYRKYFDIVSITDIVNNNMDPERFSIALSFDDGYLNNLKYAIPILRKHRVPATFCITAISNSDMPILWADLLDLTAVQSRKNITIEGVTYKSVKKYPWNRYTYIDDHSMDLKSKVKSKNHQYQLKLRDQLIPLFNQVHQENDWPYWKQLTREEIFELSQTEGVDIASHGYYHNNLGVLLPKIAHWELSESKKYLEEIVQRPVEAIAYPDGSYNSSTLQSAERIGYKVQLLADPIGSEQYHPLTSSISHRMTINPYISPINQVLSIIKGTYN